MVVVAQQVNKINVHTFDTFYIFILSHIYKAIWKKLGWIIWHSVFSSVIS